MNNTAQQKNRNVFTFEKKSYSSLTIFDFERQALKLEYLLTSNKKKVDCDIFPRLLSNQFQSSSS